MVSSHGKVSFPPLRLIVLTSTGQLSKNRGLIAFSIIISNNLFASYSEYAPGFFQGTWDGFVWLGHLIQKIYSNVDVYQNYNNGFFYNVGFFGALLLISWHLGILISLGMIAWDIIYFTMIFIFQNKNQIMSVAFLIIFLLFIFIGINWLQDFFKKKLINTTSTDSNDIVSSTVDVNHNDDTLVCIEKIKNLRLFYNDGTKFFDGLFFYERSSMTKVSLTNVRSIYMTSPTSFWLKFIKKNRLDSQMVFKLNDLNDKSQIDLVKIIACYSTIKKI